MASNAFSVKSQSQAQKNRKNSGGAFSGPGVKKNTRSNISRPRSTAGRNGSAFRTSTGRRGRMQG